MLFDRVVPSLLALAASVASAAPVPAQVRLDGGLVARRLDLDAGAVQGSEYVARATFHPTFQTPEEAENYENEQKKASADRLNLNGDRLRAIGSTATVGIAAGTLGLAVNSAVKSHNSSRRALDSLDSRGIKEKWNDPIFMSKWGSGATGASGLLALGAAGVGSAVLVEQNHPKSSSNHSKRADDELIWLRDNMARETFHDAVETPEGIAQLQANDAKQKSLSKDRWRAGFGTIGALGAAAGVSVLSAKLATGNQNHSRRAVDLTDIDMAMRKRSDDLWMLFGAN